ncbi:MAG: aminopeptidase [Microvirga sp.]|jgi:aminopeptidase N|nr:aminopeptidase [Microvirga sp.]
MRTDLPQIVRLEDYRPSDFLIDRVHLDIRLHPTETRVTAQLAMRPNPHGAAGSPLALDGDELQLVALALDGRSLSPADYAASPQSLTLPDPPRRPFTLTIETQANPSANSKLMGLYRSGGVYCTQCEAEGFRRITYFLDRPDVLAIYTTRIEGDRDSEPVLLGNGNPVERGEVAGTNRHFAVWHDPFPKPAYLFAVVGGKLGKVSKRFTTMGGHDVEIGIYVEPGKEARADYALDALERSMRWDEEAFGREYDLKVFNVVAVSDFNMGAMENKGLNIFNDKYVLASPETATDADYAAIEAIIAHEYFHNWSGNRVTCRDWFQLCLKEGLTVFRDQEFSSDMRSRPVHRISEVKTLRARQFSEDAGPLAHAVRPRQYREINNFYTATVYEKGAEIVRMLKTLIGEADFRRGMDLYFERNDGKAATVEDFLQAFADVTGKDLSHFAKWYEQAGTPRVAASGHYDAASQTYRLDLAQATPSTPGQALKEPMVIPVMIGLVALDGTAMEPRCNQVNADGAFVLDQAADSLIFHDVPTQPVPSLLRGFSAPVRLSLALTDDELLGLLRHDSDAFNRWQAAQTVALRFLVRGASGGVSPEGAALTLAQALRGFLDRDAHGDPAFASLVLTLPSEAEVAQEIATDVDPAAVFATREAARAAIGRELAPKLDGLLSALRDGRPYSPDAASAGRRALRQAALNLLAAAEPERGLDLAEQEYRGADNMTVRLGALALAASLPPSGRREALFEDFRARYRDEPLILDKWFAVQATIPEGGTLGRVTALRGDPAFSMSNPNRVRALIGAFAMANATQFHRSDGAGYDFVADAVLELDAANPQVAARLLTAFGTWKTMEGGRRAKAESALRRIAAAPSLSPDVGDIVQRSLA